MKRLVISCILILALTNQAYALGSHHGRSHGSGSSASVSNSSSNTPNNNNSPNSNNTPNNNPTNTASNGTTGGNTGAMDGQLSGGGSTNIVMLFDQNNPSNPSASVPELTTMFLLGSALMGLWGFRRKIRK